MASWAIHCDPFSTDVGRIRLGEFGSARKPSISRDDTVVLFYRVRSDILYWSVGSVDDDPVPEVDKDATSSVFLAPIRLDQTFDRPRSADELRFSLEHIYRFDDPSRHYLRPYRRISSYDVHTIVSGEVFGARTALGLLARTLPLQERVEFWGRWASRRRRSHSQIAQDLLKHIRDRYGTRAALLRSIRDLAAELRLDGDPIDRLLLVDTQSEREFDVVQISREADEVERILSGTSDGALEQLTSMPDPGGARSGTLRIDNDAAFIRIMRITG